MKTTKGKFVKLLLPIFVFASILVIATPNAAFAASGFTSSIQPVVTSQTPAGYLFGNGTWTGTVITRYSNLYFLSSTVTLSNAQPNTFFLIKITMMDSSGNALSNLYWFLFTDSSGSGSASIISFMRQGSTSVALNLYDLSNSYLLVGIDDPPIGGNGPT